MSYFKPRIIAVDGRTIRIAHPDLPGQPKSYLTAALAATGTTLTVQDNTGFANNDFLRLGKLGVERSELVRANGAVSRGTSVTSTAAIFPHPIGAEVERSEFDQWRIYGNTTNSSSGAVLIATVDMQVDAPHTTYVNAGTEYAYYLAVAYNSNTAAASDVYSDGVAAATGYAPNTVGALINAALEDAKAVKGGRLTDAWLIRQINDCLRFMTGKLKRWSFLQSFDYVLGQMLRGSYSFTLPSEIEDANSPKSVLGVRVGTGRNLTYQDKREWEDDRLAGVAATTVRTQALAGDTSLLITNSYDFDDAGSVDVFVAGVKYSITYTGVTRSATAGVLIGVPASGTGSISVTTPVASGVWQNEVEGQPAYFTIEDGQLKIYPLADSSNDNMNVFLDFYTSKTAVDSAGDAIEPPRYDAVKSWLVAKIRSLNNASGAMDQNDPDWKLFREMMGDMIRLELSGQKRKMKPKVNSITY